MEAEFNKITTVRMCTEVVIPYAKINNNYNISNSSLVVSVQELTEYIALKFGVQHISEMTVYFCVIRGNLYYIDVTPAIQNI